MLHRHSTVSELIERAANVGTTLAQSCADAWLLSRRRFLPEYEALWPLLHSHEQARAKSFRARHHEQEFVIARAILRVMIAAYCSCDPKQVEYSYGPYGKPALITPSCLSRGISFNMSHSSDAVLIGLTCGQEIGADVEEISSGSVRSQAIADGCLSAEESLLLAQAPAAERPRTLLRFWTHKEACLKAIGCGLSIPPQNLTVTFTDRERSVIHRTNPDVTLPLFGYDIPDGEDYVGAVVGTNQFQEQRFFQI